VVVVVVAIHMVVLVEQLTVAMMAHILVSTDKV
jgi:hypothetical protein